MKQTMSILIILLSFLSACQKDVSKPDTPLKASSLSADDLPAEGTFSPVPTSGGGEAVAQLWDPEYIGYADYQLLWTANYAQRSITVVMKTGVRISGSNWMLSPVFPSQMTITGGALGTIAYQGAVFTFNGWQTGVNNPYFGSAVESRTIVYTSNGAVGISAGTPTQYPVGGTYTNGSTITKTVYSVTDYNMSYNISFYAGLTGAPGQEFAWSYEDNGTTFTGVPSN